MSNSNGGSSNPNGGVSNPNGGRSNPNGGMSNPNRGSSSPNGGVSNPNGGGSNPNGEGKDLNGGGNNPNGGVNNPKGGVSSHNGQVINPNGGISNSNGQESNPNGRGNNPNGGKNNPNAGMSNPEDGGNYSNGGGNNQIGRGSNQIGGTNNLDGEGNNPHGGVNNLNGGSSSNNGGTNANGGGSYVNGGENNQNGRGNNPNGEGDNLNGGGSNLNRGGKDSTTSGGGGVTGNSNLAAGSIAAGGGSVSEGSNIAAAGSPGATGNGENNGVSGGNMVGGVNGVDHGTNSGARIGGGIGAGSASSGSAGTSSSGITGTSGATSNVGENDGSANKGGGTGVLGAASDGITRITKLPGTTSGELTTLNKVDGATSIENNKVGTLGVTVGVHFIGGKDENSVFTNKHCKNANQRSCIVNAMSDLHKQNKLYHNMQNQNFNNVNVMTINKGFMKKNGNQNFNEIASRNENSFQQYDNFINLNQDNGRKVHTPTNNQLENIIITSHENTDLLSTKSNKNTFSENNCACKVTPGIKAEKLNDINNNCVCKSNKPTAILKQKTKEVIEKKSNERNNNQNKPTTGHLTETFVSLVEKAAGKLNVNKLNIAEQLVQNIKKRKLKKKIDKTSVEMNDGDNVNTIFEDGSETSAPNNEDNPLYQAYTQGTTDNVSNDIQSILKSKKQKVETVSPNYFVKNFDNKDDSFDSDLDGANDSVASLAELP